MINLRFVPPSAEDFARFILANLADASNRALTGMRPSVLNRVGGIINDAIRSSPEYLSLTSNEMGNLRGQLGMVDAEGPVESIINSIISGVQYAPEPVRVIGRNLQGGVSISILKSDLSEVLGLDNTSFVSEGGHLVDWLRWLLTAGGEVLVHKYEFFHRVEGSRTGLGVMGFTGRSLWTVPPEFQGTFHDNWLTRSLAGQGNIILGILQEEFVKNFK